ncbi:60S ribosomal protein L18a-like protein [Triticum dicoccoides]|uniref:60S ribosomal protein L18a-like protein n=1 Tax=Triticum dicoccoides TaxID=85692 RepID=UPI001890E509|nr:60S ribosomal protein L18a-like protein [Triticum dicoccoides]
MAMQQTRDPTAKLPSAFPVAGASPPPPYHHHHYGTFSPPPPPPAAAAAYDPSLKGRAAQGVVAFPCTIQQQVLVEGLPVREPRLPFCGVGVGVGWVLFLLGFFLAAIPWYIGAFLLFFVALDHREKPGLIACTVAGIFAVVPFMLNGVRMRPFFF